MATETRTNTDDEAQHLVYYSPVSPWQTLWFWIPVILCVLAMLSVPVAFFLGGISAQSQLYYDQASQHQERIEAFFASHPSRFGGLTVGKASDGWAYPSGSVSSQSDYDFLKAHLLEMFGDELGEQMMYAVEVEAEQPPEPPPQLNF
jgi:hypothetical protein